MAIVVVGGGAIGSLVVGRLAQAGQPVALLARANSVDALKNQSLTMVYADQPHTVPAFEVATDPQALPDAFRRPQLAILCVKGYATTDAVPTLAALQPQTILTLQNGLGNEEVLADRFGTPRIVAGAITSSVEPEGYNQIVVTKNGGIGLAPLVAGGDVAATATLFRAAGFETECYANYRELKWSKVLLNMLGNGTAAILDWPVEQVYADGRLIEFERQLFLEALAVMHHMHLSPVDLPAYPVQSLARAMRWLPRAALFPLMRRVIAGGRGGKDPSLLRDLRGGRTVSEGANLYGEIARQAAARGTAAPLNAALWQVLGGIVRGEREWDDYRHQPDRLLAEVQTLMSFAPHDRE